MLILVLTMGYTSVVKGDRRRGVRDEGCLRPVCLRLAAAHPGEEREQEDGDQRASSQAAAGVRTCEATESRTRYCSSAHGHPSRVVCQTIVAPCCAPSSAHWRGVEGHCKAWCPRCQPGIRPRATRAERPGAWAGPWPAGLRPPRTLDVCFVSSAPVERHARPRSASRAGCGGHPVPRALVSWIPAFAGMTRGHKHWQCIYEMDI